MELEIKRLQKRDHKKAIDAAIHGMRFHWYIDSPLLLKLYGRYFWYLEMGRATQVIAAYLGDQFAGVLLAEIRGEEKKKPPFWKALYVKAFDFLQNAFFKDGVGSYNEANLQMYSQYYGNRSPDGEIIFLAANPQVPVKGIGSMLLKELECREPGKELYLYTDSACTYQFYEHRGFHRCCERDLVLELGNKKVPLKCMLYRKVIK